MPGHSKAPAFELVPPFELSFQESSEKTSMYMQKFKIVNLSVTQKLAFKIKTTSPKQYIVRPKTGIIPPNSFLEIEVLKLPREDKIIVLGAAATPTAVEDLLNPDFWQRLVNLGKGHVEEKVIECQFGSGSASSLPEKSGAVLSGNGSTETRGQQSGLSDGQRQVEVEREIRECNESMSRLELELATLRKEARELAKRRKEEQMRKEGRHTHTGIVPSSVQFAGIFASTPQSMFPPALVFIICIIAFLCAKVI